MGMLMGNLLIADVTGCMTVSDFAKDCSMATDIAVAQAGAVTATVIGMKALNESKRLRQELAEEQGADGMN